MQGRGPFSSQTNKKIGEVDLTRIGAVAYITGACETVQAMNYLKFNSIQGLCFRTHSLIGPRSVRAGRGFFMRT